LLCEQLILHGYCLCVIDPEGDYTALEALPGVTCFGGADPLPRPRDLLRALRHPDMSAVIDLSHTPQAEKLEYVRSVLPGLALLRRHTGLPHRVLVDEAHYFLHGSEVPALVDLELNGYTLTTYRASLVHPALLRASQAILVTRESDPSEVAALLRLCTDCKDGPLAADWEALFGGLALGEAAVLPLTEEAQGGLRKIRLAPRLTPHVRHLTKYVDIPVPSERGFVFWQDGGPIDDRARTLREFVRSLETQPEGGLLAHARRADFSRWVAEVFGDHPLAAELREIEKQSHAGGDATLSNRLTQAIRARYEFVEPITDGF
jgi:hypothetical protein